MKQRYLPKLNEENFLIVEEVEVEPRFDCAGENGNECQRLVEDKIQEKVRPFILKKLEMA